MTRSPRFGYAPLCYGLQPVALIALAALLLAACQHRDFCYDHNGHEYSARAEITADYIPSWEIAEPGGTDWRANWPQDMMPWTYESLVPPTPTGLRVTDYRPDATARIHNTDAGGGIVPFSEGSHQLLFYNNDVEFIDFAGLDSYATAYATTRTRTRSTYHGNALYRPTRGDREERTLSPPDVLYAHYITEYSCVRTAAPIPLHVTLQPVVHTYVLRFIIKEGREQVALARGALAGMAAGVWLTTGENSHEAATLLFDCDLTPWGAIARVRSFGVPGYPRPDYTRATGQFAVSLEIATKSGTTKTHEFDITPYITAQPRGGVVTIPDITVDDSGAPGSAFLVDVSGWGPFEDVTATTW